VAYLEAGRIVCASCAGAISIFACPECGCEDHPYGSSRCARCILRERLTELLTDPATRGIRQELRPVFDALAGSERPQTGIWWLRKKPGIGPRLLGQMARGEIPISHDTFRHLPSDRAHNYLRELLAALGVLPPYEARIERMLPWLDTKLAGMPDEHSELLRRYARWHLLRQLRRAADEGRLTKPMIDAARSRITAAARFLAFLAESGIDAATAPQVMLENYQVRYGVTLSAEHSFIAWLRTTSTNTALRIPTPAPYTPAVTVSDAKRWSDVKRLLHDDAIRPYTRIAGLFTLLFAQPLARIVAMSTQQVALNDDGRVSVTFQSIPIEMPAPVDRLVREHLERRGKTLYAGRDTGWLFPGGNPGRPLETENIRNQLVAVGIHPYESRKAALYQLAGEVPAPVLAELIGITPKNAVGWAKLAARDWSGYLTHRANQQPRSGIQTP
jgi:hypothetical protein